MKLLHRETARQSTLTPIDQHPEYQSRQAVVHRLKSELNALSKEQTDLVNRANQFRRSSVEVLSAAYLREEHPSLEGDGVLIGKKISELRLRINALHLAVQSAEREVLSVKYRLSAMTAEEQTPQYRTSVRRALSAMLAFQRANTDIVNLFENREALGYSGIFVTVGLSPWPYWGDPKDDSSQWRSILKECLELGHISAGEHSRIINGVSDELDS